MNKKSVILTLLFLLGNVSALGGGIGGIASVSLEWITPTETSTLVYPNGTMNIKIKLSCINGPCQNISITIQYCEGEGCNNYSDILYGSGKLRLVNEEPPATQYIGTFDGIKVVDWNINWPTANIGEKFNLKATATGNIREASITGREIEITAAPLSASILSPSDGNTFTVGSTIDFNSNIVCENSPCSIQWDSNQDTEWNSTDENFSFSGLSIGDHNITLTVTDSSSETATDSIVIHVNPLIKDVFSVSDFELIKVEPSDRFAVNGKIRVKAKVNYFLYEEVNAKAFIIISDPLTGQAIYGPSPFYLSFSSPSFEEYDLNIDLSKYDFEERKNYKVEFLVVSNEVESSPEYFVDPVDPDSAYWADGEPYYIPENQITEQNKANNSAYMIVELGPATLPTLNFPETNYLAVGIIAFIVLALTRKKKRNSFD
jgi:hypothetical protein